MCQPRAAGACPRPDGDGAGAQRASSKRSLPFPETSCSQLCLLLKEGSSKAPLQCSPQERCRSQCASVQENSETSTAVCSLHRMGVTWHVTLDGLLTPQWLDIEPEVRTFTSFAAGLLLSPWAAPVAQSSIPPLSQTFKMISSQRRCLSLFECVVPACTKPCL